MSHPLAWLLCEPCSMAIIVDWARRMSRMRQSARAYAESRTLERNASGPIRPDTARRQSMGDRAGSRRDGDDGVRQCGAPVRHQPFHPVGRRSFALSHIWLTFLGCGLVLRYGGHIGIEALQESLPPAS